MASHPLRDSSIAGLAVGTALAVLGLTGLPGAWSGAHGIVLLFGFLVPALESLNLHALARLVRHPVNPLAEKVAAQLLGTGTVLLALGAWLVPIAPTPAYVLLGLGALVLLAASGMLTGIVLKAAPRRGTSVVDLARDPLTKGDDACVAQVRFAHFFLPLGVLGVALSAPWWAWGSAAGPVFLAMVHVLLVGYGLVSIYALSHFWVPRLSGVPAIAAGAIKGELHSTLLGIVLLVGGFLLRLLPAGHAASTGLLIMGGVCVFIGTFTFMGVLGANIMKNKSPTQRVTPEFAYVPWAFAGVFWVIAGVLMGIFLNAVPGLLAAKWGALRFTHVHSVLTGGAAQLFLGYLLRVAPRDKGLPPAPFAQGRWGFYSWNLGTALLLWGALAASGTATLAGALLITVGLGAWFIILLASLRPRT
ncbi:MAG TPA: hypothetical protein VM286_09475 [Candidatus Thermoplasmatota archaeon]|nr:hypothetical protein [Candidatus Thermoplasmatota archaeon]